MLACLIALFADPFHYIYVTIGLSNKTSGNTLTIILTPSVISATTLIILFFVLTLCATKRMILCEAKKTTEDPNQQPTYEEIMQCHKDVLMEGNAAYDHVTH